MLNAQRIELWALSFAPWALGAAKWAILESPLRIFKILGGFVSWHLGVD